MLKHNIGFKSILLLVILSLFSCNSMVTKITSKIKADIDSELTPQLKSVIGSWEFYEKADTIKYWYSENTTKQEVWDDKFKTGISKLTLLSNDLDKIATKNSVNYGKRYGSRCFNK